MCTCVCVGLLVELEMFGTSFHARSGAPWRAGPGVNFSGLWPPWSLESLGSAPRARPFLPSLTYWMSKQHKHELTSVPLQVAWDRAGMGAESRVYGYLFPASSSWLARDLATVATFLRAAGVPGQSMLCQACQLFSKPPDPPFNL